MIRMEVDFNSRDDEGLVPARVDDADGPFRRGDLVETFDDEGYRCLAIVGERRSGYVALSPIWETFTSPVESRARPAVEQASGRVVVTNQLTMWVSFGRRAVSRRVDDTVNSGAAELAPA